MSDAAAGLKSYLEQVSGMISGMGSHPDMLNMHELVLEHGTLFPAPGESLSEAECETVDRVGSGLQFEMKECFYNAQRLAAISGGELRYFEGFATRIIPVHHAWVVTPSGKVVDLTWRLMKEDGPLADRKVPQQWADCAAFGQMADSVAYMGVEIPEAVDALDRMGEHGWCYSYLDDWTDNRKMLERSRWESA
jgi:hypothetical protein